MSKCLIHGRELTLLFTSARCDECDGLIKPHSEAVTPFKGFTFAPCGGTFEAVTWGLGVWAYFSGEPAQKLADYYTAITLRRYRVVTVTVEASAIECSIKYYGLYVAAIRLGSSSIRTYRRGEYKGTLII